MTKNTSRKLLEQAVWGNFDLPPSLTLNACGDELLIDTIDGNRYFNGIYRYCGSKIERLHSSNMYDALVCEKCWLHIDISRNIETHDELKKFH